MALPNEPIKLPTYPKTFLHAMATPAVLATSTTRITARSHGESDRGPDGSSDALSGSSVLTIRAEESPCSNLSIVSMTG
eukprot:m.156686 g.156686  ORF g.156686 m.156686 type:complete len:79 (-) comp15156_c0_seq14:248-484(-)